MFSPSNTYVTLSPLYWKPLEFDITETKSDRVDKRRKKGKSFRLHHENYFPQCIPVKGSRARRGKEKGKQDKRNSFGILRLVEFCSKSSGGVGGACTITILYRRCFDIVGEEGEARSNNRAVSGDVAFVCSRTRIGPRWRLMLWLCVCM